jgi:putative hydrolase of the HAD superfamily
VHPYVTDFLDAVRRQGKRVLLVTNAHIKSLELKMERTRLGGHFDHLVVSHDFGLPKEDPLFWDKLQEVEKYDPQRTLLVDDSLPVLRSARDYGIRWLLAVYEPDTQQPRRDVGEFDAIETFKDILPA